MSPGASAQGLLIRLVPILLMSAALAAWAVANTRAEAAGAAAALFAALAILIAAMTNRRLRQPSPERLASEAASSAAVQNATLIATTYAWGAATLAAVYLTSGVVWQHGLQYASGMALIALLIGVYAWILTKPGSRLGSVEAQNAMLRLTILHAAAAGAGLAFLFMSGKLKSGKGDWPANIVFLIGGATVLAQSVFAAQTQMHLTREPGRKLGA